MNSNINKKKITFFINQKFLKYVSICLLSFLLFVYIYNELIKKNKFNSIIQEISEKYNYQFKKVEINSPKFGSGLAGGNWYFINDLIEDIWGDFNVYIYNYSKK